MTARASHGVLVMAGGTGGHVFPGLAVAQCLRRQGIGVVWLGARQGLEARVVPAAGIEIEWIRIQGLRGRGVMGWLLLPVRLMIAVVQAMRILLRRRPAVVLSMGGFVAGPGGLVSRILCKPLLVHEQNAIPGMTNRWLAVVADKVMCGFPGAFANLPGARYVGNPVRAEFRGLPSPQERMSQRQGRLRLLVIGGSQGAQVFNKIAPEAIRLLADADRPDVWHQCGRHNPRETESAYRSFSAEIKMTPFIEDMAQAYEWADLVMCRAGAITIAELSASGNASILIPYPHAVDDHQTANAQYLVDREAAIVLPESELTAERLCELIKCFTDNRELLLRMAEEARRCAMPDATETVARLCMEAMHA